MCGSKADQVRDQFLSSKGERGLLLSHILYHPCRFLHPFPVTGDFFSLHMAGDSSFGYVWGPVTDEEVELI